MLQWLETIPNVVAGLPSLPKSNNMNQKIQKNSTAVMLWLRQNLFSQFIPGVEDEDEESKLSEDDLESFEEYIWTEVFNVMCAKVKTEGKIFQIYAPCTVASSHSLNHSFDRSLISQPSSDIMT